MQQMLYPRSWLIVVAGFVSLVCASAAAANEPGAASDADVSAIRRVLQTLTAAINVQDIDRYMANFTENSIVMAPYRPAFTSREAIQSLFQETIIPWSVDMVVNDDEIMVDGNVAVQRYTYSSISNQQAGEEPSRMTGKGMLVLRRQANGTWKVRWSIWNIDGPL